MLNVYNIIKQLESTSSTNEKISILKLNKDNELLNKILKYTYGSNKYGVSNKVLEKILENKCIGDSEYKYMFMLLDVLASNSINDKLRRQINIMYYTLEEHEQDIFKRILLKDLRINIGATVINKAIEGLIHTSEGKEIISCMLAKKFDLEKEIKEDLYITEKVDGFRCNVVVRDGNIEMYTRQGKLITGCKYIEEGIKRLRIENMVFDGEILAKNCSYEDVYKETSKRVKNKNEVKEGIEFVIFDIISLNDFDNKESNVKYSQRRKFMDTLESNEYVRVLPLLYVGIDKDKIIELLDTYRGLGAEGLMVNNDKPYEFKRSNNCKKIKVMQSCDLTIVGFEEGTGKYKDSLGSILVDYKGNIVGVGSGYLDEDRNCIWKNKEELRGRICEVSFFEVTKNKEGFESLRFPVFKCIREVGKEISYS